MVAVPIFVMMALICAPSSEEAREGWDIAYCLPESGELKEWEPVGSPRRFEGEELYSLIDGGAVIYYEYGFRQVITQEYTDGNGKSINVEIYEMKDPASAYGIYTLRTGDGGVETSFGSEGMLEDYYLNFWKGHFLVTVIGSDTGQRTLDGISAVARAVDAKIESEGERPALAKLLPEENLKGSSVTYMKGPVALSNRYRFDSEDLFGLREGITGDYGTFQIFIFRYNDENESLKCFKNARHQLKEDSAFTDFTDYDDGFSLTDRGGKEIHVRPLGEHLVALVGTEETDTAGVFSRLQERIEQARIRPFKGR
jgi:hypothetical protein